jgi:hypothetical protein
VKPGPLGGIEREVLKDLCLELFEASARNDADADIRQEAAEQLRHPVVDLRLGDGERVVEVERGDPERTRGDSAGCGVDDSALR